MRIIFTLTGYLGHYSISKRCESGAAMEEIYPFNEYKKTIMCMMCNQHQMKSLSLLSKYQMN